ncbi:MAG: GGDEF domain-containing protein [Sulfuricurvum sp.]|jgi:EAL domain-containing protein (putative c-di-GMP-specific phosphodiesterase class I)/GGDEF domain-containing protein|uniref:GGDEF domain-containing protein n=1 Tax=Sulfuricurvum sp. TaxID=2025608 RepID=UPI0025CEB553|nr:GGDEF domain-containing protein [Sulfuricurvum sp.]MCK9372740.1 GGDEF domain-containing protein [Sulfuricurvum sp.]
MKLFHPLYHHYLTVLDIAFQPIVDIHTGEIFGVEALLRGTDTLGYESIGSFFDALYADGILYRFDVHLREKVVERFRTISGCENLKLFYNIDNRLSEMADFSKGNTSQILQRHGLDSKTIVFELSERNEIIHSTRFSQLIHHYKDEGFCIAIDDFGIGQSGYKFLYHCTPNIIKIDRFFLTSIDKDPKKKLLVRHIVQLATLMGCRVIAVGIENEQELVVCKEVGCHMVQGYFIQYPTLDSTQILHKYPHVSSEFLVDKRSKSDQNIILKRLEYLDPIIVGESMESLLDRLKQDEEMFLVPVVDAHYHPLGIIHEHRLKSVIYSPYGRSLIQNRSSNLSVLENYIELIPIVDLTMPLETIIELLSLSENAPGVLVMVSSRYIGYLSARVMIEVIHERNLIRARDENPLSRLPGNYMINEYIARTFETKSEAVLCYFDFDHFKPYNDYYGFRNGDRVILLFVDLMHKGLAQEYFKGHIGGDDFFLGVTLSKTKTFEEVCGEVERVILKFGEDVREFYDIKDREQGCIIAEDRDGTRREFKLLGVSSVVIRVGNSSTITSAEQLQRVFSIEKKTAKKAPNHMSIIDK